MLIDRIMNENGNSMYRASVFTSVPFCSFTYIHKSSVNPKDSPIISVPEYKRSCI